MKKYKTIPLNLEQIPEIIETRIQKHGLKNLTFVLGFKANVLDNQDLETYKNFVRISGYETYEMPTLNDIHENAFFWARMEPTTKINFITFAIGDIRTQNLNLRKIKLKTKNRQLNASKTSKDDWHIYLSYIWEDKDLWIKLEEDIETLKPDLIKIFEQEPNERD